MTSNNSSMKLDVVKYFIVDLIECLIRGGPFDIWGGGGGGGEENMEINKMFPILLKINKLFSFLLERK